MYDIYCGFIVKKLVIIVIILNYNKLYQRNPLPWSSPHPDNCPTPFVFADPDNCNPSLTFMRVNA